MLEVSKKGMRILHVIAGVPQEGGGLVEAVAAFAEEAVRTGHDVTLATVAGDDKISGAIKHAAAAGVCVVRFLPAWPQFLFFSWGMLLRLRSWMKQANIVHVHSSWTFPVWWACWCAWRLHKPIVMSPHGALDPVRLAHSAWKKRLVGGADRFFLCRAAMVHATSMMEHGWIEKFAEKRVNVAVVPNGVRLQPHGAREEREKSERTVLYLGRNHPLKGLDILEAAWRMIKHDGWRLGLVGPGLPDGLIAGDEKWRALRSADVFVLPTRSEGFPLSVLEALAVGTPVITTKRAPWAELISERCGWWVDVGVEPLAKALQEAMSLSDEERWIMGENGRRLVERKYQWEMVSRQMVELYESASRENESGKKQSAID